MKPNTKQKIYRPYNETFDCYHDYNLQLGQAKAFIKDRNRCKGGHWVLHTEFQYQEWLKTHPKPPTRKTENQYLINDPCFKAINQPFPDEESLLKIVIPMQRRSFPSFIDASFVVEPANKINNKTENKEKQ